MKRFIGIDIIKVFAVLFVISVHFFRNTNYYGQPLTPGENLFTQTALRWLFIICVPLFITVTGYLQSRKKLSVKYYKGLLPVLGIYLLYSIGTILVRIFYFKEDQHIIKWIYEILSFKSIEYSWYVNMYIGLFLLIPFLNLIFNNLKNMKEHLFLISTLVVMTGLPGLFNYMPLTIFESNIVYFPDWWLGIYPLAYYFIGCYIKEYKPEVNKLFAGILLLLIILLQTILTYHFSHGGPFVSVIGEYGSLLVMISTTLFFIIFYDVDIKNKAISKAISTVGGLTLDIYLSSYLVDRFVYQYVMVNVFKSTYQIIYYFVPIVGTIIITTVVIGIVRKIIIDLIKYLLNRFRHEDIAHRETAEH